MKIYLCIVFLLSWCSVNAQWSDTTYDFSTFVLPDVKYRSLSLTADLGGSTNKYDRKNLLLKGTASDFNTRVTLGYFSFLNTLDKQLEHSGYFSSAFNWERSDFGAIDRDVSIYPRFSGNTHMRWYRESKFKEMSILHYSQVNPEFRKDDDVLTEGLNASIHLRPFLLRGSGRIEPINIVAIAHFLIQDLSLSGLLNGNLTNDDLNALGQHMVRARYQRIFEAREARKYELSQIDSMIQSREWIDTYSIDYFTILADNWLYDFYQARSQGRRFSYGIAPHIYYQHSSIKRTTDGQILSESESNSRIGNLRALVRFEREKPLSITRQRSFTIELSAGYDLIDVEDQLFDEYHTNGPAGNVSGYYGLSFFPNSRTIWRNILEGAFDAQYLDEQFAYALRLGFSSSINYYLSPRARIMGSLNLSWIESKEFVAPVILYQLPISVIGLPLFVNAPVTEINGRIGASLDVNFVYQLF